MDPNIVIKPTDKGEGICIQDKYEAEIYSQLSNTRVYKKINKSDSSVAF